MSELTHAGKVALITGITGQDGSYLTEFLLSKGYTVRLYKRIFLMSVTIYVGCSMVYLTQGYMIHGDMTCFALKSMRFFFLQVILL
mmetsp:Transcript_8897/g.15123  ORF Transcript_8897/g.15123 Transcript_8897/m.15123 type:complete len:86 (-) Transcript_8897:1486-1743(-)